MAVPTFVQKSRINQVIYQIRDGRLLISERQLLGKFQDRELDLSRLDPDYQPGIARNYTALIIFLVLAALCGTLTWAGMRQSLIPQGAAIYVLQWPAIAFVVFLSAAIKWSRRIEYYRFSNRSGHSVLVIIREREQAAECAAFITTLVAQIEIAQSDVSPEERSKRLRALGADRSYSPAETPGIVLWQMSITCGVLAAGVPWLPNIHNYLGGLLIPLVILLSTGGAALSVFSFLGKEGRRWWSIIGLVLALIPPVFYT